MLCTIRSTNMWLIPVLYLGFPSGLSALVATAWFPHSLATQAKLVPIALAGCCESGFEHLEGGVSGGFKRAAAAGLGPRTRHREAMRRATATRPRGARVAVAGHHGLCQKAAKGRARVHVRRSLRAAERSEWRSSPILARVPPKCSARAALSGALIAANARVVAVARQGTMPRYSRKRL